MGFASVPSGTSGSGVGIGVGVAASVGIAVETAGRLSVGVDAIGVACGRLQAVSRKMRRMRSCRVMGFKLSRAR
jgi:hypothetical protein